MSAFLFIFLIYVVALIICGLAALYEAVEDGKFDDEIMARRDAAETGELRHGR